MEEEAPSISYEKLKIQEFSKADSSTSTKAESVLANFGKLDFSGTPSGENFPKDDINYNEGKPANPFNKIGKYYGRHLDVFLFISTLRDEKQNGRIMELVREKCGGDEKAIRQFRRKMNIYLDRVERGEIDATELVKDTEVVAFFNGYHVASEEHPRNIHENLNVNVEKEGTILETSSYFHRITPRIEEEETSQLRRQKIYANGERVATIVKTEDGQRNYMFSKGGAASLELEIGWNAVGNAGNELKCVITLGVKRGRLTLEKVDVDTEEDISVFELAKQNKEVLVRGKTLHDFLEKKYLRNQRKEVKVSTNKSPVTLDSGHFSSESIIVEEIPAQKESKDLQEILNDISKLSFSKGPFSPDDELNYNEGRDANPFDKFAKLWGRKKDVFQFNSLIRDEKVVEEILDMVGEKCGGDAALLDRFKKRMSLYLERIRQGETEAKPILSDDMDGFFHGYHVATPTQPRNERANLNINLKKGKGEILETSQLLTSSSPKSVEEDHVERLKLYGNGKRMSTIEKNERGERNYCFSRRANMDLEIVWRSAEKDTICTLTLGVKCGKLHFKNGTIDGVGVASPKNLVEVAAENKSVLVKHSALSKVLAELLPKKMGSSKEKMKFEETIGRVEEEEGSTQFESLLEDFGKVDWNEKNPDGGKPPNQFAKIRKFYGRHKNIFLFIDVVRNEEKMERILDIVRTQYPDDPEKLKKFIERKDKFLEAIEKGTEVAKEFLGDVEGVLSFFSGHPLLSQDGDDRNVDDATLNIKVLKEGTCLDVSDLFDRSIGQEEGGGLLKRVKIYDAEGRRVVTILKDEGDMRKYTFTKDAQLSHEIKWTAYDKGGQEVSCSLTLKKVVGAQLKVKEARVDGKMLVEREDILEVTKQNEVVKFKDKSLEEMLKQSFNKKAASDEFVLIDDFGIGDDEHRGGPHQTKAEVAGEF